MSRFAEDKKLLEQRSKELTQSRRQVDEKVEEIRQQIEETKMSAVNPVLVTSQVTRIRNFKTNFLFFNKFCF